VRNAVNWILVGCGGLLIAAEVLLGAATGFDLALMGVKQAEILKAEGDAQARVTRANAEAEAIRLVSTAAESHFKERAETMRRLEVLDNTLGQNTKYIVPSNSTLVNALGLDAAAPLVAKKTHSSLGDAATPPPAVPSSPAGRS